MTEEKYHLDESAIKWTKAENFYCEVDKCNEVIKLRQERDELKKTVENQKLEYEELQCDLSEVENACGCYQSENAELKQENKELKSETLQWKQIKDMANNNKYRSALEEIRKIVTSAFAKQRPYKEDFAEIENIINEVLNLS